MNRAQLLLIGMIAVATLVAGAGRAPHGAEQASASQPAADSDGDGIPDPADLNNPQPGEDWCPALAEDPDGVQDQDGCPDSDVSVSVSKEEAYTVTIATPESKTVDIWINNGNYAADVLAHALAVSTIGACEVTFAAQPGDQKMWLAADEDGDTIVETLQYLLEWEISLDAGESQHTTRDYQVVCFLSGDHSFEIQVDAVPLPPVREENVMDLRNVHKNFPVVTVVDPVAVDADGDGFPNADEGFIGTDALVACDDGLGSPDWPPDFNDDKRVTLGDVLQLIPVFSSDSPGPPYNPRFDLNTDGRISLPDALQFIPYLNESCG